MTPFALQPNTVLERIRRICNLSVGGIWIYQGLVPKLLGPHSDEVAISSAFGIPPDIQVSVSYAVGIGEILFGLCILLLLRRAWPQVVSAIATAFLLVGVAYFVPHYLIAAFNPVVMNLASIALSIIAVLSLRGETSRSV